MSAEERHPSPAIKLYTVEDGLLDGTITGVVVDQQGQLILATQQGLNRFNGHQFLRIPNPDGVAPGLVERVIDSDIGLIGKTPGHGTWLLQRPYTLNTWRNLSKELLVDVTSDGRTIFALLEGRICEVSAEGVLHPVFSHADANHLAVTSKWLAAASKNSVSVHNRLAESSAAQSVSLPGGIASIESLLVVEDRVFIGTNDGLLEWRIGGELKWLGLPEHLRGGWVPGLAVGHDANQALILYAATGLGLVRIPLSPKPGEPTSRLLLGAKEERTDKLLSLAMFSDGVVVGGMEHGLAVFDERKLQAFARMPGRPNGETTLGFGHDGSLFLGHGHELYRWRGTAVEEFRFVGSAASDSVRVVKAGQQNNKPGTFIGTNQGRALWLDERGQLDFYLPPSLLDSGTGVFDFENFIDAQYVATWRGLIRVGAANGMRMNPSTILPLPAPQSGYAAKVFDQRLWVATNGEYLAMLERDGSWHRFGAEQGIPASVTSGFARTADGFFVSSVQGIVVLDPETLTVKMTFNETSTPPLYNHMVYHLSADSRGAVYAATNKGLHRITRDADAWHVEQMNVDNGLLSNAMFMNSTAVAPDDKLFVATARGVSVLNPKEEIVSLRSPPLLWEQHSVNGVAQDLKAELNYTQSTLGYSYALPQLVRSKETEYRSQLVGLDPEPTSWSHSNSREFTTLPAGDYEFRVWARDHMGRTSASLSHRFIIHKAPWNTWWAFASYAAAIVLVSVQVTRWRIKNLQEAAKVLEAKVAERTHQLSVANTTLVANADELKRKATELEEKNGELEEAQRAANRIFNALALAMEGKVLDGKYRLDERIGEGGFGIVFRARREADGLDVAVKVFRPTQGNDSADALQRFKLEAKSASMIRHRHAISVFDSGVSEDGVAYMAMELLRGSTLQAELDKYGKIVQRRALGICVDVCDALARAHELKVIHRDIKPDNIFLCAQPDGSELVKVLDFGIAKFTEPSKSMNLRSLTMTGAVVGTPAYLAPERLSGSEYDARSDVYAVGIMLYQMLVGRVPFESDGSNVFSIVWKHINEAPPLLTAFDPSVSEELQKLVMAALVKDPNQRPTADGYRLMIQAYFSRKLAATADDLRVVYRSDS